MRSVVTSHPVWGTQSRTHHPGAHNLQKELKILESQRPGFQSSSPHLAAQALSSFGETDGLVVQGKRSSLRGKPGTHWVPGNGSSLPPSSPILFLTKSFSVSSWHWEWGTQLGPLNCRAIFSSRDWWIGAV